MYRDECNNFCVIEKEWGDDYYCKLACGKFCHEGPITYCKDYEERRRRKVYLKKHGMFTKEEFDI